VVTEQELADIPEQYRRTIARWLLDRAERCKPSRLLDYHTARQIQGALGGAAVDLADPLAEDTTTGHARNVITDLTT
jgi:hypothetical protein